MIKGLDSKHLIDRLIKPEIQGIKREELLERFLGENGIQRETIVKTSVLPALQTEESKQILRA